MMSIKLANYTIMFEGYGKCKFSYPFNSTTNFYDLLEFLAYISPFGLQICFCYEIQIQKEKYNYYNNSVFMNLDKNEFIKDYQNGYLKIIPAKECKCGYNDYLKKSKKDIIDSLIKYKNENKNLDNVNWLQERELDNYEKDLEKAIKEKEKFEAQIFEITNKNELANKEINKLKSEIERENELKKLNNEKIQKLTAMNKQLMEEKIGNEIILAKIRRFC